ncbi:MAG: hypothetical protein BRD50_05575 [Bacteroidetes bacterium SW_11_45_7]|nr:MAG: hypothetical protein BRD50_05575 [Bacteroidetes bacterium SW_11_45_7]
MSECYYYKFDSSSLICYIYGWNQIQTCSMKHTIPLSLIITSLFLLNSFEATAQGKDGFLHMDKDNNKEKEEKNQYRTLQGQPDTIKLFDKYGEYRKDTVIYQDERVKHGVWVETDSSGNRVRRRYDEGEIVEEEKYKDR